MARKRARAAQGTRRPGFFARLRGNFLTGLVIVAPVVLTAYLIWTVVTFIDDQVVPWVPSRYNPSTYLEVDIPGFGVVIFVLFTAVVGTFTKNLFGRQLVRLGESVVDRMPIVRSVYNAVKQIVETIFSQSEQSFKQACLVEYPRQGMWSVAFISTETRGEIPARAGVPDMLSIFLPTTPNPTSGFLLFVPRSEVVLLDMDIEAAAKLIISAGLVMPPSAAEIQAGRRTPASARAASGSTLSAG
ncbi:DUF502 domain-containing protein [Paroceanicella profunda]|uniref:DUF502 domain-containing protein n=1 Tax=Paroceanicella profunda TaxID=2579971 RepID=A0A5B8FWP2_9RHOB|nr:DUF502 domain-containing protein [Paroceanicella profunda]QDL92935.1 DUF502 domain-containing protein [Paroceanicella profunda]